MVTVAVVAAASMAAAGVSMAVADLMAARVPMEARVPMVENVATKAAAIVADLRRVVPERAAVRMATVRMQELAAIPARREVILRIFIPPLPMASGIRSATPAVSRIPVWPPLVLP